MVLFPIGATWKVQRYQNLFGAYFDEAWHLLEELRYSSIKPVQKTFYVIFICVLPLLNFTRPNDWNLRHYRWLFRKYVSYQHIPEF